MTCARVAVTSQSLFILVFCPFVICSLGFIVVVIGLLEGDIRTILIGSAFAAIVIPGCLSWIPGCREIRLEDDKIVLRNYWRDKKVALKDIKETIVTHGIYLQYYAHPGGAILLLNARGYFGVRKSILIPDIFNINKFRLVSLINEKIERDRIEMVPFLDYTTARDC